MEAKSSILNALLQQAMFNSQPSPSPVNLSLSSINSPIDDDDRSVCSSSDEESALDLASDLSGRKEHGDSGPSSPSPDRRLSDPVQLHAAVAAAFSFQHDMMNQQSLAVQNLGSLSPDPSQSALVAKALASATMRRPRSEKKPIPEDLKDQKYFERRRRNNLAAKRSRDARKNREDQVTLRANLLEKENSILRAQVATLRDEAFALKQMLLHKQTSALIRQSQAALKG